MFGAVSSIILCKSFIVRPVGFLYKNRFPHISSDLKAE